MTRSRTLVGPILFLTFSFLLPAAAPEGAAQDPASVLETRGPIAIDGNADFTAANGVTGGRGTPEEPFVIEGWRIRVSGDGTGVDIRDTTAPFIIRNVDIGPEATPPADGTFGVRLHNVRSAALEESTLDDLDVGLLASDSEGIRITNTTFRIAPLPLGGSGLALEGTRDVLVRGIEITGGRLSGVSADRVRNLTVEGSNFYEMGTTVVRANDSVGLTVRRNAFLRSGQGVSIANTTDLAVELNFFDSNDDGMELAAVRSVTIVGNEFLRSIHRGIHFVDDGRLPSPISEVRVYHNRFDDNADHVVDTTGFPVVWDDGYPSGGNHWSEFVGPDRCRGPLQDDCSNRDGIVDAPYDGGDRPGFLGHVDRYPLVRPYTDSRSPPRAALSIEPMAGDSDTTFRFDATNSTDAEDRREFLEVRWDFDGDRRWDTDWSLHLTTHHRYAGAGTYRVRAEVRDTTGDSSVATVTLVVDPVPLRWTVIAGILWATTSSTLVATWVLWTRAKRRSRATQPAVESKR